MDKLANLLQAHQLLIGHPNLKNLQRVVADTLAELDASYAPKAVPTPASTSTPKTPIVSTPVSAEVPDEPAIERRI